MATTTTKRTTKRASKRTTKRNSDTPKLDAYEKITQSIIDLLESGTAPWRKGWTAPNGGIMPVNFRSKKRYRGVNVFTLIIEQQQKGYSSPFWLTYKRAQEMGGQVRKGEKSTVIVFWRWIEPGGKDAEQGEGDEGAKGGRIPILKTYNVFNLDQIDGIDPPQEEEGEQHEWSPIEECERIVSEMPQRPPIHHRGSSAFYQVLDDAVVMPEQTRFEQSEGYYSVLFHELAHSTGHKSRLARFDGHCAAFGSPDYSQEELVAEMTAAFLCGEAGIVPATIENSAAYIKGWLKPLKNDKRFVVIAAAQAQKAADWILDRQYEDGEE